MKRGIERISRLKETIARVIVKISRVRMVGRKK